MLADTEDVALTFEQSGIDSNNLLKTDRIRHPIALLFHLAFRTIAIIMFLFASAFSKSFITMFVMIIICLSMDFWTVKNVTGRLLVGLRWWNYVDEEGKSHWIFENRKNAANSNNMNSSVIESTSEASIFWLSLIVADIIWVVFFLISLFTFSFKWMTIIFVAISLNGSNTYGFLKCKFGNEQSMKSYATSFFGKQMFKTMLQRATTMGSANVQTQ